MLTLETNAYGVVVALTDALGHRSAVTVNAVGRTTSATDGAGRITYRRYDDAGRLVEVEDPVGQKTRLVYDAAGRVVEVTRRNHEVVRYTYDEAGRVAGVAARGDTRSFAYDGLGRLVEARNDEVVITKVWHLPDHPYSEDVVSVTPGRHPELRREEHWSWAGRFASAEWPDLIYTDPDGDELPYLVKHEVDDRGRLSWVSDTLTGSFAVTHRGSTRISHGSGLVTTVEATPARRVRTNRTQFDEGVIDAFQVTRDVTGQVRQLDDSSGTHGFDHDLAGQLVHETHPPAWAPERTYAYDAAGHRKAWSGNPESEVVIDPAGRLLQDAGYQYTYDAEGQLTERRSRITGRTDRYHWDGLGQLVGIDAADGTLSVMAYDALGRRVELTTGEEVYRFAYGPDDRVRAVFDGDHRLRTWLTLDDAGMVLAAWDAATQTRRHAVRDHLGTVRGWVDEAGQVSWVGRDAFGVPTEAQGGLVHHAPHVARG